MAIQLQDVFDAIHEGQGWLCVSWLHSKLTLPELKRDTIRLVWAEHNGIAEKPHKPVFDETDGLAGHHASHNGA